jgi:signal transduction histidine kinase
MAQAKNVRIETDIQGDAWIKGNFGLLQRVIINLLTNAIKYSQLDTSVKVNFYVEGHAAILKIIDSGPGIAPEKLKVLFKRFSRIEGQYQEPTGSGLGLYFVDMCIKKHGGHVIVNSAIGHGAEFCIELPIESIESACFLGYNRVRILARANKLLAIVSLFTKNKFYSIFRRQYGKFIRSA